MPSMNILMNAGCGSVGSCGVAVVVGWVAGLGAGLGLMGDEGSSSILLAGLWMDEAAPPTAAERVWAKASIASG